MISSMSFPWQIVILEIEFCQLPISCHVKIPYPRFLYISGVLTFLWLPMTLKCCLLWINWLGSWIILPFCSWCFCSVLYQTNVKIISLFISTDSCHHKTYVSELKILFMYKLWPKTLSENCFEVSGNGRSCLVTLKQGEDEITGGNSSDKGIRRVDLWP